MVRSSTCVLAFCSKFRRGIRPALSMNSNDALYVSMGLHELATNAVKYGALFRRRRPSRNPLECGGPVPGGGCCCRLDGNRRPVRQLSDAERFRIAAGDSILG